MQTKRIKERGCNRLTRVAIIAVPHYTEEQWDSPVATKGSVEELLSSPFISQTGYNEDP